MDRFHAGPFAFRISAALLLSLALCLLVAEADPVSAVARPVGHPCSTAGLQFSEERGSATYGDKVVALRTKITGCATARSVATQVAQDLLQEVKVPRYIEGLKVTLQEPCGGCAPNTAVTAKAGEKLVTFTVEGGA